MKESPARFADLAGLRLYRRNIFAVTGLPVAAQGPAVRRHRQRLEARIAVEETWAGDAGAPAPGGYRREEVRHAFEEFQDPRRRLVDELLWFWRDVDLGCGCAPSTHEQHDEAVRVHSQAIEAETGGKSGPRDDWTDRSWRAAATAWSSVLENPDLRRHVAHRITALADPRLDGYSPDDFLAGVPGLLLSPFGELAGDRTARPRLAKVSAGWAKHPVFATPLPAVFEDTVEESLDRLKDALQTAGERHLAGEHADALATLEERVLPAYAEFESLKGFVSESRSEEMAHTVTVALNNVALGVCEAGLQKPFRSTLIEVMEHASRIAPRRDKAQIAQNLAAVRQGRAGTGAKRMRPRECFTCVWGLATVVGAIVGGVMAGPAVAIGILFAGFFVLGLAAK